MMPDIQILHLLLVALGVSWTAWAARRWWVRPLRTLVAQGEIDLATAAERLEESKVIRRQLSADVAQYSAEVLTLEEKGVKAAIDLKGCRDALELCNDNREQTAEALTECVTRRDQLLEQLAAMGNIGAKYREAEELVTRYHFALTSPLGMGDPIDYLVAVFAHFGHSYTPPAEIKDDTPEPAPTEGT